MTNLKELEKQIKGFSAYIEEMTTSGRCYYEEDNQRHYVTSIEQYIHLKALGKLFVLD